MAEHRVQNVDSAPSQAEQGLVVTLALATLAVVVRARWLMPQAGESRQEQCVLEAVVPNRLGMLALMDVPECHGVGPSPA